MYSHKLYLHFIVQLHTYTEVQLLIQQFIPVSTIVRWFVLYMLLHHSASGQTGSCRQG